MSRRSPNSVFSPRSALAVSLLLLGTLAAACSSGGSSEKASACPEWRTPSPPTAQEDVTSAALQGILAAGGDTYKDLDLSIPLVRQRLNIVMRDAVTNATNDVLRAKKFADEPDCSIPAKVTVESHIRYTCNSPYPAHAAGYGFGYTSPYGEGTTAVLATFDVSPHDVAYVGARAVPNLSKDIPPIYQFPDTVSASAQCTLSPGNEFLPPALDFAYQPEELHIGS